MPNNCVFCAVCAGEIPAYVLHENGLFLAILDRFPATPGHALILPKRHAPDIFALTDAESAALLPLAKALAEKMRGALNPDGLNLLQNNGKAAGQAVFHFHLHLIPRYSGDSVTITHASRDSTGPPAQELEEMTKRLRL